MAFDQLSFVLTNDRLRSLAEKRLRSKVQAGSEHDCWEWIGALNSNGYGSVKLPDADATGAHRLAYAVANDASPGHLHVLHRCDNRRCCNPAHLFLGTNADNVADKVAKGRAIGPFKLADRPQSGELAGEQLPTSQARRSSGI